MEHPGYPVGGGGITCNAICPGNLLDSPLWTEGPNALFKQYARNRGISEEEVRQIYVNQVPMKRGCTYEDVCNVVVFLASARASYITGATVDVSGGMLTLRGTPPTGVAYVASG